MCKVKAIILFGVREKFADLFAKVARAPYLFSLALTGFEYIYIKAVAVALLASFRSWPPSKLGSIDRQLDTRLSYEKYGSFPLSFHRNPIGDSKGSSFLFSTMEWKESCASGREKRIRIPLEG